jgi:hypothetical protein
MLDIGISKRAAFISSSKHEFYKLASTAYHSQPYAPVAIYLLLLALIAHLLDALLPFVAVDTGKERCEVTQRSRWGFVLVNVREQTVIEMSNVGLSVVGVLDHC